MRVMPINGEKEYYCPRIMLPEGGGGKGGGGNIILVQSCYEDRNEMK